MAKRRVVYDDDEDVMPVPILKRSRENSKQPESMTTDQDGGVSGSTTRWSTRSSKGTGGQLARMQEMERIQTECTTRPSKLDLATQGEAINPMAPSSQDAGSRRSRGNSKSKVPVAPSETHEPPPLGSSSSIQPAFSQAAPGQAFGFRLPASSGTENQAPPRKRFSAASSQASTRTSTPATSLFSGRSISGMSTAPTSRASSVCSTSRRTYSQVVRHGLRSPPPRLSTSSTRQDSGGNRRGSELSGLPPSLQFDDSDPEPDHPRSNTTLFSTHRIGDRESTTAQQIDEASPSEDEMLAESVLREGNETADFNDQEDPLPDAHTIDRRGPATDHHQGSQLSTNTVGRTRFETVSREPNVSGPPGVLNRAEDVVATHRHRNRAPHLPTNAQLLTARRRQVSSNRRLGPETSINNALRDNSQPSSPTEDAAAPQNPKANPISHSNALSTPAVSPATEGAEPWQLQYYDPSTRDVIERAKQFSHCDAASINAFPVRPHFNAKAVEYIEEAIAERQSRGLLVSDGWWPHHSSGITRLLWEDLGNWQSALRKKARTWVTQGYEWDPERRRERNVDIAKQLLGGGGLFLRDGSDAEGHVNNLAHPALSGLVIDFFYTGSTSVGKLFPEVFQSEVPRVSVAVAVTALKVVLDEVVSGQAEVSFKVGIYFPVYTEILGLMDKCDTNPIHAAKTKDLHQTWARLGSGGYMNAEPGVAMSSLDVDLG